MQRSSGYVLLQKLPNINRELAERLLTGNKSKTEKVLLLIYQFKEIFVKEKYVYLQDIDLLVDERFSALFKNPDFQMDVESEVCMYIVYI